MRGARVSHSPRPRGAPTTPGDRRRAHTRRPGRGLHPGTARPPSSGPHAGRLEVGVPGIASARGPAGWEEPPGACLGAWDGGTQRRRARPPGSTQGHGTGGLSTGEGRVTVLGEGLLPAQVVLDPDPVECPGVCILEKQMGCGGGGQRKELGCPRGAPPRHCQGSQLTQPLGRGQGPPESAVSCRPSPPGAEPVWATTDKGAGSRDRAQIGAGAPGLQQGLLPIRTLLPTAGPHCGVCGWEVPPAASLPHLAPEPLEDGPPGGLRSLVNKGCIFYSQIKTAASCYLHVCTKVRTTLENPQRSEKKNPS